MIRDADGSILTPSFVRFNNNRDAVVGLEARRAARTEPHTVASEFKIHMGDPKWRVSVCGHEYDSVLLSAYLLRRLKQDSEHYLGGSVAYAVVTVPAYFTHLQRLATKRAAEIAGFEVLRLINEPTAAAIDHANNNTAELEGNLLVFDLGGGTLDVTILSAADNRYSVTATDGFHDLGGLDWDELIVGRIAAQFLREEGKNIRDDDGVLNDVKTRAEELKKALTRKEDVETKIPYLANSIEFRITRREFEEDGRALLRRCTDLVKRVLLDADLATSDVAEVLLVGGSTRMPMIRELLGNMFTCEIRLAPSPDESVARGAALVASKELAMRSLLSGNTLPSSWAEFADVTTHSLGELLVINADDVRERGAEPEYRNAIIIPRFSKLPAEGENTSSLFEPTDCVATTVTEGETEDPDDCAVLGEIVTDLGRQGNQDDDFVTFYRYDTSGMLTACVIDVTTGLRHVSEISVPSGMTDQDVRAAKELLDSVNIE
jgi:molecular chaperone DnaK